MEDLDFGSANELRVDPRPPRARNQFEVRSQTTVGLEEIPLIEPDPETLAAIKMLEKQGYRVLEPVPVTRVRMRQARRTGLDQRVRNETGRLLAERGINPNGHELDRKRLGWINFVVVKAAIDQEVNAAVGRQSGERHEFTRLDLDRIDQEFPGIVARVAQGVVDATD